MASKVCFRFKACSFNSKMSPELLKPMYSISDVIKFLPRTQKRLITTQSRTSSVSVTSRKNQINSTCILTSNASPLLNQKPIRSNILQDGSNRFLKTLSSLLSQGRLLIQNSITCFSKYLAEIITDSLNP